MYQRSREIEQRLHEAVRLIRSGKFSTPSLAAQLGVSIPTVSRYVTALRERGHIIRSERKDGRWRYLLVRRKSATRSRASVSQEAIA